MPSTANSSLKVGLVLPSGTEMMGGDTACWSDLLAFGRRAEELGFDSLWVADHMLFPASSESEAIGAWECWSLLAALAGATTRVELGPLVNCVNYRNPALLAKMAETVDEISGGRLILGLGAGWHEQEFSAHGFPFDHRVSRFEEAIQIIAGLLRNGEMHFEGTYHQTLECLLRPRGPRPSGLPILIGTDRPRMLRLTARYADAWNGEWVNDLAALPGKLEDVDAACLEVGRDPTTLQRTASVMVTVPGFGNFDGSWVGEMWSRAQPLTGTTTELAAYLRAYAALGISHVQAWLYPNTVAGIEAFAPVLKLLEQP